MPSTRLAQRLRFGPAAGLLNDGTLRAHNSSTLHLLQLVLLSTVFEFDGYSNNIPSLSCHSGRKELQIKQLGVDGDDKHLIIWEVDYFPSLVKNERRLLEANCGPSVDASIFRSPAWEDVSFC